MDAPLISVIVPVYKVEKYLRQCVDSILAQTWDNLEILLVDDGSPDRCGEICDQYAAQDGRVRVYHKENGGLSSARNYALDYAHGDWVGFVDSDDWLEPNMYEVLVKNGIDYNADVSACNRFREYADGTLQESSANGVWSFCGREQIVDAFCKDRWVSSAVWNKLYKRAVFDRDLRFQEGRYAEDILFCTELMLRIDKMVYAGERLYHYRMRAGSIINQRDLKKTVDYWNSRLDRHNKLQTVSMEYFHYTTNDCIQSILQNWKILYKVPEQERRSYSGDIKAMSQFAEDNYDLIMRGNFPLRIRLTALLARHNSLFSYWLVYNTYGVYAAIQEKNRMKSHAVFAD